MRIAKCACGDSVEREMDNIGNIVIGDSATSQNRGQTSCAMHEPSYTRSITHTSTSS